MDRWSWGQVQLVAECIAMSKAQQLEAILGPIAIGLGAEYKSSQVRETIARKGKAKRLTTIDRTDPAAVKHAGDRDAALMMQARQAGIRVVVQK